MTDLKPCPFCKCKQAMTWHIGHYYRPWIVECCQCQAQGPHADTEKEAMELWNKRTDIDGGGRMTDLKPCPFCHGDVELRPKMDGRDETFFIHCMKCHMWFEKFDYRAMDEKHIMIEWNRRDEE